MLSGIDKSGKILYVKGLVKENSFYGLVIRYGSQYQYIFKKDLPLISASFN